MNYYEMLKEAKNCKKRHYKINTSILEMTKSKSLLEYADEQRSNEDDIA